jgi:ABC-type spermidine/putrescine transport system permease subunit I
VREHRSGDRRRQESGGAGIRLGPAAPQAAVRCSTDGRRAAVHRADVRAARLLHVLPGVHRAGRVVHRWDGFNPPEWIGLDNFRRMADDAVLHRAARNNIVWAIGKIFLSLVPPFLVAELIFHVRGRRLQYLYRTLFVIPIIIPSVVTILIWTFYYRSDGLVNDVLGVVGLDALQRTWLADQNTALGALIFMGFPWIMPFNLLIFYAGLQAIPVRSARRPASTALARSGGSGRSTCGCSARRSACC